LKCRLFRCCRVPKGLFPEQRHEILPGVLTSGITGREVQSSAQLSSVDGDGPGRIDTAAVIDVGVGRADHWDGSESSDISGRMGPAEGVVANAGSEVVNAGSEVATVGFLQLGETVSPWEKISQLERPDPIRAQIYHARSQLSADRN
jgi:hypothetical protein